MRPLQKRPWHRLHTQHIGATMNLQRELTKTARELEEELGAYLIRDSLEASRRSPALSAAIGRAWFNAELRRLHDLLCAHRLIRSLVRGGSHDLEAVGELVLNEIARAYVGWPAATLAARIIKYGLRRLCSVHADT